MCVFDGNAGKMFVVITDFNGYQQTKKCLEALFSSSFQNFQTIVVDHGTSDETRIGLERDFPKCIRLSASTDLWWAGAVNVGVRYALINNASALILLNNDCYVEHETLELIVAEWLEHPDSVMAPIQIDFATRKITSITPDSCLLFGFPTRPGPLELIPEDPDQLLPTKLIIGGRGVIIPSRVFGVLGLFDEYRLPHYGADHDFYFRARSAGVQLYIVKNAVVAIDNTRTSIADNPSVLTLGEFIGTLTEMRSHRSISQVSQLFRKHYPIKHLYMFGVFLYLMRYVSIYGMARIFNLFKNNQ